ncbi:MAG: PKD domain-containing protein [Thermococcus sp.]|uniref:PKD domain-containing protein n=1 Tax=Thermococcus sp. TaxID=35749 RepID=UPI001D6A3670|nr:PKD domain-containing protein [Thermococcus sp.]MBO8174821.1 PKD domain-containing protein [Thermococcus sp.]
MKKVGLFVLGCLLLSLVLPFVFGNDATWIGTLSGVSVADVATLTNGDIVVVGEYANKAWIGRFTASGDMVWERLFNTSGNSRFLSVAVTPNGDIIVGGIYYTQAYMPWILRLNENGTVIWQHYDDLGLVSVQDGMRVSVSPNGDIFGIFTTGQGENLYLYKFAPNGSVQWGWLIWTGSFPILVGYLYGPNVYSSDSSVYIISSPTFLSYHPLLLKFSSNGTPLWAEVLYGINGNGAGGDIVGMAILSDDSFYVASRASSLPVLAKFNSNGSFQWAKTYNFSSYYLGQAKGISINKNRLIIGGFLGTGNKYVEYFLMDVSLLGNVNWAFRYDVNYTYPFFSRNIPVRSDEAFAFSIGTPGVSTLVFSQPDGIKTSFSIPQNVTVQEYTVSMTTLPLSPTPASYTLKEASFNLMNTSIPLLPSMSFLLNFTDVFPPIIPANTFVSAEALAITYNDTLKYFNFSVSDGRIFNVSPTLMSQNVFSIYAGNATIQFTQSGNYTIRTYTVDEYGNILWKNAGNVSVVDIIPSFNVTTLTPLVNESLTFNASSTVVLNDEVASYSWDFGDGTIATGSVVTHSYSHPGNYTVTLTVTDIYGFTFTASTMVQVSSLSAKIIVNPSVVNPGMEVNFSASIQAENTQIVNISWDFGDNTGANGTDVRHSYSETGNYTVTLMVTDIFGHTCTATAVVTVVDVLPFIHTSSTVVDINQSIIFDASLTVVLNDMVSSYLWDFGDGTTATGALVSHMYANSGNYTVTLIITDIYGFKYNISTTVVVKFLTTSFTWDVLVPRVNETIHFIPDILIDNTLISNVTWDFGDGTVLKNSSVSVITHAYLEPGNYTVTLTVTDIYGDTYTFTAVIHVVNVIPNFLISPEISKVNETVVFNASATAPFNTLILSYNWDFGDNSSENGEVVYHTYLQAGNYTVTLTITDVYGYKYVLKTKIQVINLLPNFTIPSKIITGSPVQFTSTSTVENTNIEGYHWMIDGDFAGNTSNITWVFSTSGYHVISLTITDTYGYNATLTIVIMIQEQEVPSEDYWDIYYMISRVWTVRFLHYYSTFKELRAIAYGVDNNTLNLVDRLNENASTLVMRAWNSTDIDSIQNFIWQADKKYVKPWLILKALRYEQKAVEMLQAMLDVED